MNLILAQFGSYSFIQMAEIAIVIAAVVAIVLIGARAMGVNIPGWFIQIGWVIIIAVVCIYAIKLVMSMV